MDPFIRRQIECVQLSQLAALTTLLVWTRHSCYRFVVMEHSSVWVQGGAYFGKPTRADLTGATKSSGVVMDGFICIGRSIELHIAGTRFTTSPVQAMTMESARDTVHYRNASSRTEPRDLVFGNRNGEPFRESTLLTRVLQPAAEAAGIGRVTWHQFRHIHSSLLNDLRVPVKIAQEQLGHSSISTTLNIYTHVVDASHRKAIVPKCS